MEVVSTRTLGVLDVRKEMYVSGCDLIDKVKIFGENESLIKMNKAIMIICGWGYLVGFIKMLRLFCPSKHSPLSLP